jgi:hypothetical protein
MFSRRVLFVGVLVAAVGVPYLLFDKRLRETARGQWQRLTGLVSAPAAAGPPASPNVTLASAALPSASIEEAFRFEVRPDWVMSRWPQVTTVAGGPNQLGMRVALVSGTRPDDVAGSLTYYFDEHHQLQRLTFTGQTADARRLLAATVTPYGLTSLPTTGAAHYVGGNPKQPTSQVLVKYLPQIAQPAASRLDVSVDLRREDVVGWDGRARDTAEPSQLPQSYRPW